jgi:DNA repair protein RadA/Sms
MKTKTRFVCRNCQAISQRWAGKCHMCGEWNTFEEETISQADAKHAQRSGSAAGITTRLGDVVTQNTQRISTGITEFNRVLGGGIIPGSLILVGGDPGIGKSTLMLQMCAHLPADGILYITGEESLQQIKLRASRLQDIPDDLQIMAETDVQSIAGAIRALKPAVAIVDSIQTTRSDMIESTAGSVSQVRECTALLMQVAKKTGTAIFIVGHVTKEGSLAGPKVLEHTVDTVLQFEGDQTYSYRILRAVKNRFGSTNEIGIFDMAEKGLREVSNPSEIFLSHRQEAESGTAIVATMEGTRPLLIEVQALVTPTGYSNPQRTPTGYDYRRLQMIIAVLEKRLGLNFREVDVFVNIAGGLSIDDPAIDMGVAAALVSSLRDSPLESGLVIMGEIGLTGEIRPIAQIEQRLGEIQKLGFKKALLPKANMGKLSRSFEGIQLIPAERIALALTQIVL